MAHNVNASFVLTESGVLIFDTGSTIEDGNKLRNLISHVTDKPILYVVNSHSHPNHCGGNMAFSDCVFLVHRLSPIAASAADFSCCPYETIIFSKDCSVCIGGFFVEFRIFSGHSCDSLLMVIPQDRVVVTGDLLFSDGLPSLGECCLESWAEELAFLETFEDAVFVPGHGPVTDASSVRQQRVYLESLMDMTSSMKRNGLGLDDLDGQPFTELPYVSQYMGKHKENLRTAFLQVA
jgi:glyoxylase-like metal-dependent hydrolase (beta-lactamase superfamily II)